MVILPSGERVLVPGGFLSVLTEWKVWSTFLPPMLSLGYSWTSYTTSFVYRARVILLVVVSFCKTCPCRWARGLSLPSSCPIQCK